MSSSAPACPHCGRPTKSLSPRGTGCLGFIFVSIVVIGVIGMCSKSDNTPTSAPTAAAPAAPDSETPARDNVSPSFDCTKARSQAERLICSDSELSALDADLAALYKQAKSAAKDKRAFARASAAEWKKREATCLDKPCLVDWYALRRRQLSDILGSTDGPNAPSPTAASDASATPESAVDLTNAKVLDEKYGIDAEVRCASGADDYLRSVTKYDFRWDDIGFLGFKFDRYVKSVVSPGVLTSTSNKVKIQNGFGAYQRAKLLCDYDTQAKQVLRYSVTEAE